MANDFQWSNNNLYKLLLVQYEIFLSLSENTPYFQIRIISQYYYVECYFWRLKSKLNLRCFVRIHEVLFELRIKLDPIKWNEAFHIIKTNSASKMSSINLSYSFKVHISIKYWKVIDFYEFFYKLQAKITGCHSELETLLVRHEAECTSYDAKTFSNSLWQPV